MHRLGPDGSADHIERSACGVCNGRGDLCRCTAQLLPVQLLATHLGSLGASERLECCRIEWIEESGHGGRRPAFV
jgi:hypothetical protein